MDILFAAGVMAVLAGLAVVVYMTWRNSAATGSIAQVLHDVEHPAGSDAARPVGARRP